MKEHPIQGELREWARNALQKSAIFSILHPNDLEIVLSYGRVLEFDPSEELFKRGDAPNGFFLILTGEASVIALESQVKYLVEVQRAKALDVVGDLTLLVNQPRSFTVFAAGRLYAIQFDKPSFDLMMTKLPNFSLHFCRRLAERTLEVMDRVAPPRLDLDEIGQLGADVTESLPSPMLHQFRVFPLQLRGNFLKVCAVEPPTQELMTTIQDLIPNAQVQVYQITHETFLSLLKKYGLYDEQALQYGGGGGGGGHAGMSVPPMSASGLFQQFGSQMGMDSLPVLMSLLDKNKAKHANLALSNMKKKKKLSAEEKRQRIGKLLPLLHEMAAKGASDLHLSAKQKIRWRIDGDLYEIPDSKELGEEEVYDLLEGMMPERCRLEFEEVSSTDFSYTLEEVARYRVNMYMEDNGISAALRQIPLVVPTVKQLRLPSGVKMMADLPQGLVLVTGPTGSGKSTTLAALINAINQKTKKHIITLEDPIEFVHPSQKALVHQREVGTHTATFDDALRASLREDPDIILVGELRDLETMALAVETAHTGHLVFGTLHTNNVVSTIDRIIDLFPAEQQNQIRTSLSDTLKGVVCQTLCRRTGGGRVAAFEVMLLTPAIANMIRQGKTHQIAGTLVSGKGNIQLNAHLEELVKTSQIDAREAVYRAIDKEDMRQRLGARLGGSVVRREATSAIKTS